MSKNSPKIVRNEYDILKSYAPGVIMVLSVYLENRQVAWLCKESLDGLNPVILTRIIQGDRPLSPFVLKKLLLSGVVTLNDILQDRSFEEIPDDHKVLLMRLLMTDDFILKLAAFSNLDDVEKIIDRALKKTKKQQLKALLQSLYQKH
ncbi:MAG: hypothetical protein WA081_17435 [Desulfosalsimonadaceae bacterium]